MYVLEEMCYTVEVLAVAKLIPVCLAVRKPSQLFFLSRSVAWKVQSCNSEGMMLVWSGWNWLVLDDGRGIVWDFDGFLKESGEERRTVKVSVPDYLRSQHVMNYSTKRW